MARFKNTDWNLPTDNGRIKTWEQAQLAVLMDIRDELQRLNNLLYCQNFIGMPHTLKRIDKRLAKHAPLKSKP